MKQIHLFTIVCILLVGMNIPVFSQTQTFNVEMRAVDEVSAITDKTRIKLWGITTTGTTDTLLKIKARSFLDDAIGKDKTTCTLKGRNTQEVIAQCANKLGTDLGLLMIQNGYAIVDRSSVYNTIFETPYLDAEKEAQILEVGIWRVNENESSTSGTLMMIFGFGLFICIIIVFIILTFLIMRGFQRVIDAQNRNMDLNKKERALKDKEREIFASMLDTEIKANKSKIEAYIIVYDEMLKSLKNPDRQPKYQTVGDIVQKQPALSRAIFDRNTEKLDVLGKELASDVIHFYARIKTKADYINLEPDLSIEKALEIVEQAITNAKRLNNISDRLIDTFAENGLSGNNI